MARAKLLHKVLVIEIHQPKKNKDINPFFRPYVLSLVKIKIVKNPCRFKILMTFHFCVKTASARKSHRKACFAIRFVLWMRHCSERRVTSNLIIQALLSFTRNYVQVSSENSHHESGKSTIHVFVYFQYSINNLVVFRLVYMIVSFLSLVA